MPAAAMTGLMVAGTAAQAYSQRRAGKKAANAQAEANRQNIAAHTMTPQEKAQFFSSGMSKINSGYASSLDSASRALAARGLGGNAVAAPLANVAAQRARTIGDLWGSLSKTAMDMKSSTPTIQPVVSAPSIAETFAGGFGKLAANAGSYGAGQAIQKYFK
jgi:hypothetical protein